VVIGTMEGISFFYVRRELWHPPTDVYETESQIIVKVEIAGVNRDELDIQVEEGLLTVRGRRADCSTSDTVAIHRMEIHRGDFETHVYLPRSVITESISATYSDGMLTLVLPKEPARKVRVRSGD